MHLTPPDNSDDNAASENRAIGLIAGWGRFPLIVAEQLKQKNYCVICCGIKGHADPGLAEICDEFRWFGLAKLGQQLRFFQQYDVTEATMAGKIFKTLLLEKFHLIKHLPDFTCLKHFYPIYFSKKKDRNDDTLLLTVTELFGAGGVDFKPATDFVPDLLVSAGPLTQIQPNRRQLLDIQFAWRLAKEMGRIDVGQSVCVKDRAVIAVEAIEGTDACIQRAGQLCQSGGIVVAKVAKPEQDMRFDVPTIGTSTLENMRAAGADVLAIEADRTIILDRKAFLKSADELRISVVAFSDQEIRQSQAA